MFVFQGDLFEYNEDLQLVKNLFLDFFRGEQIDKISLQGLDKVIVVSADVPEGSDKAKIYFRVYCIDSWGSSLLTAFRSRVEEERRSQPTYRVTWAGPLHRFWIET